jgi:hypothetical protein
MKNLENIKSLPKIEVSFQDDFAGDIREITLTPNYILKQLDERGVEIKIGDKILLWEKDEDIDNGIDYICEIGEVTEANADEITKYTDSNIEPEKFALIKDVPFFVKIGSNSHFRLSEGEWGQVL